MRNAVQLCLAANNILHMRKGNHAFLLRTCDRSCVKMADRFTSRGYSLKNPGFRQIIDLLATDKSQYFAQPNPIIVNYPTHFHSFI